MLHFLNRNAAESEIAAGRRRRTPPRPGRPTPGTCAAACLLTAAIILLAPPSLPVAAAVQLWVGVASTSITPERPVPLTGYQTMRVSTGVHSPCTATVLALEAREGEEVVDQAMLVSCDLCVIRPGIQDGFRRHVADRLKGFNIEKLFLAATHTHAAPVLLQDRYQSYDGAMEPKDYVPWMNEQIAKAAVEAWQSRAPAAVAWGLGHAVVGCNRRAVFANGAARMYGGTNSPTFRGIEGYEDHALDVLCCYDQQKRLTAAVINVPCPSQSVRGRQLSADFWHDVRALIRQRHGEQVGVLGFCAPAGDQGPHLLYRKPAEARMARLRGLSRTEELGRRIADAFDDVLPVIEKDMRTDVPFEHLVDCFELPGRRVADEEYARAKAICDAIDAKPKMVGPDWWKRHFWGLVVERYEAQQTAEPKYPMEMHVIRLGDLAIATNPFELYVDYGVQIQARSPAPQTMLIQLAAPLDFGYYVPTPRALEGRGYSAEISHNLVGPKGGQALVDRTVADIGRLFEKQR